jgi:pimeloyl-ACP methyl ester carboxylesterase
MPEDNSKTFDSWSADVREFADQLNLDKFALLGYSAGGPWALAVACRLHERVSSLCLVSSLGPRSAPDSTKGMSAHVRFAFWAAANMPAWTLRGFVRGNLRAYLADAPAQVRQNWQRNSAVDLRTFDERADVREQLVRSAVELARRNSAEGMLQEYALLSGSWEKRLQVPAGLAARSCLWHGLEDAGVPASMSRHIARHLLPGARLHLVPSLGHLALFHPEVQRQIFDFVLAPDLQAQA